jgi:hypothetical protein
MRRTPAGKSILYKKRIPTEEKLKPFSLSIYSKRWA